MRQVRTALRATDFSMDDPVRAEHIDPDGDSGNKRRSWRGRFALGLLVLIIVLGYVLMFLAFDFWFKS